MASKKYETDDLILSSLDLPDPCPVKIEIRDGLVCLHVGQRDWQWDAEDGSLIAQGTNMT